MHLKSDKHLAPIRGLLSPLLSLPHLPSPMLKDIPLAFSWLPQNKSNPFPHLLTKLFFLEAEYMSIEKQENAHRSRL